jgi:MoaA/NifB/PqqE/SkfB family radical SAM enzyme
MDVAVRPGGYESRMSAVAGGMRGVKQVALRQAVPLFAHLELTYACNWRCVFCYNPRHFDKTPLRLSEWETVLDDLRRLGTLTLTLTGGEPLAHPEFFEIAAAARQRSFALRLFSNGSLITEDVAARIAALRPLAVELSLHGGTAATHDRTTGRPGSFDAMTAGLRALRAAAVPVVLKTPLTAQNEAELDAMIALAAAIDVPYRIDPTLTPKDDGDRSPLAYRASAEGVERLMRRLKAIGQLPDVSGREAGGYNCGLGRLTLAIDPEGNVFPCLQWRHSALGNVRRTRLADLWAASPERQAAADVSRAANDRLLQMGPAVSRIPFCPALAAQHTGDPLALDDEFLTRAALAEKVRETTPAA